jgi:hypothetical protein
MPRLKLKAGDVFTFDVNDNQQGAGQIIIKSDILYVAIFEPMFSKKTISIEEVTSSKVLFIGFTVDSLLYHGRWKLIGHKDIDKKEWLYPSYKYGQEGKTYIEDFFRSNSYLASNKDVELFDFRSTVAPIRYQKAYSAFHGLETWDPVYEKLLSSYIKKRCSVK